VRPGSENNAVTDAIQKVAESYKCKPISGMLSHQLKQFRIDGEKSIIQNPTEAQKKDHERCEFDVNEVYAIDVLISTGEGKVGLSSISLLVVILTFFYLFDFRAEN